ncbi:mRNA-decapping enzyme 1B isoform X2 [Microcaecilia unicolor]|uniref:5'-(N(7)-methylguanosine 5'-triphospho)-[mRNA] hydrolase n=1 Tax=Microcaecilia unicolor TaxID=1415580 RepID=A0A6P7YYL4_9AMPH|nr:mRNA-decapping enzyme 1B isoform X2 [Microcaecilia unicolor]
MAAMGNGLIGKGLDISLAALQRHDPYINSIVDVASQVALYTFSHKASEWEKTDVEGTLFVYTRSASPKHGFTIMNRLSMENRTEPISKDLDFQLQDPFLLYRNARFSIYGIWFYDKEECQRIAELMKNLTHEEQLRAQHGTGTGASPLSLNPGDSKQVDILQMLTKAKDEYTKYKTCSEPKQMTSSTAIYNNPNLIKPIPVKPSENLHHPVPHQGKFTDLEPQHLSLMALFGKQDKTFKNIIDQPLKQVSERPHIRQGVVHSLSYEEPARLGANENMLTMEKQLCPAIQKLVVHGTDLQPVSELLENRLSENDGMNGTTDFDGFFQPAPAQGIMASLQLQDTTGTQSLLQKLQGPQESMSKLNQSTASVFNRTPVTVTAPATEIKTIAQPQLMYFNDSLQTQTLRPQPLGTEHPKIPRPPLPLPTNQMTSSGLISPQELLNKLQIVQQEQHFHGSSRPALAAKFPVVAQTTGTPKPLDSWMEKQSRSEKQNPLFQVISPQRIPATVTPSLLMTPMVFTQSTLVQPKGVESGRLPLASKESTPGSASLLLPPRVSESSVLNSSTSSNCSTLTKAQLQETLLHLIRNDDNFLNIIYDAYLSSVTKGAMKKKM